MAVPVGPPATGVLFAGLPTSTATGLPFHINATFFPSPDRKRVIDDPGDYRTEWNLAAVEAAGQLFAEHLPELREPLGPVGYWNIIKGVGSTRESAASSALIGAGQFWEATATCVHRSASAYNTARQWVRPPLAPVLLRPEEANNLSALEAIGIRPMHDDVRGVLTGGNLIRNDLGTLYLPIDAVVDAVVTAGLVGTVYPDEAPGQLGTLDGLDVLWTELGILLSSAEAQGRSTAYAMQTLRGCSIAMSAAGMLIPLATAHQADAPTRILIEAMGLHLDVIQAAPGSGHDRLLSLCPQVDVSTLITAIENLDDDVLDSRYASGQYDPEGLLAWLAPRLNEIDQEPLLLVQLKRLRLFPTESGLGSLDQIAIPGDFQDPLGLADVVNLPNLAKHRQTLIALHARELTIGEYAFIQVPRAFLENAPEPDVIRRVVRVLADHVPDLEEHARAKAILRETPLIECIDGQFRAPSEVVMDGDRAREVLGVDGPLARLPSAAPLRHQQLWGWLEIATDPTAAQVEARIKAIVDGSDGAEDQTTALERVCLYMNGRLRSPGIEDLVGRLALQAWLPARDDQMTWHEPPQLYPIFQDYLFESQAKFLGFGRRIQNQLTDLMVALGLPMRPPTLLIVKHLLACAAEGKPVNRQVWEALSQAADDPALRLLRDKPCLLVDGDDIKYRRPNEVFWRGPTFGGLRVVLGTELARYRAFFDAIGVKETPDLDDAIGVLNEIAEGHDDTPLDERLRLAVYEAWRLITENLDDDRVEQVRRLASEKTALDGQGRLCEPTRLYIEDRPLLADGFPDDVRGRVVGFDPSIAEGLRAAGARDFSHVVAVVRLQEGDTRAATALDQRLLDRWPALVRVIWALSDDLDDAAPASLADFDRLEVDDLWVRYELSDEPGAPSSEPEQPHAIYVSADSCLYVRGAGSYQWRHVARELAVALRGPRTAHRLASNLSEVLRADSLEEAERALDELGVARVVAHAGDGIAAAAVATALGGVEGIDDVDGAPAGAGRAGPNGAPASTTKPDDTSPGQPAGPGAGPGAGTGPTNTAGSGTTDHGAGTRSVASGRHTPAGSNKGSMQTPDAMLRSWVQTHSEDARELDPEVIARRKATDEAGIKRAMRYESEAGRTPSSMPHANEGFDIESRVDGEIVRFIEVKSQSGLWRTNAPSLSKKQHDHAVEKMDKYWLYIVELAGQPGEDISTIQDPIGRATHFGFDPGWRDVAFDPEAPYEELDAEIEPPDQPVE